MQGECLSCLASAVSASGGVVTHRLPIIDAVGVTLTDRQLRRLRRSGESFRIHVDHEVESAGRGVFKRNEPDTFYPALVEADRLHEEGITERRVTVAVVDTGFWPLIGLVDKAHGGPRVLAQYDAIRDWESTNRISALEATDAFGHATHILSVIANSRSTEDGEFSGVAPDVDLVVVKAVGDDGRGRYADVIRGIDWAVVNKDYYGIRVLNLSLTAPPRSHYWDDPLNQAVMRAWQSGIVVVTSAGNRGPDPMTVGVPGNIPYVVTVGAMSDADTPLDPSDDFLASFSSAGPTLEGFVKPEMLAPGGHMLGLMGPQATIATEHPEFQQSGDRFVMSGTSQAAAVVSGTVALMLDREPWLSPDEVKCRLMAAGRPAVDENSRLAYSVFQQGAGLVNAYDASHGTATGCANRGLDVEKDLAGLEHYGGPANVDGDGNFFLMGLDGDGYGWDGAYPRAGAYLWSTAFLWTDAFLWANARLEMDAYLWADTYLWADAFLWVNAYRWHNGLMEPVYANVWVDQE